MCPGFDTERKNVASKPQCPDRLESAFAGTIYFGFTLLGSIIANLQPGSIGSLYRLSI